MSSKNQVLDVIIIGGGPAGLNAAVVLGRCRRNVLLFDAGNQRNIRSHGIHNFLTRDGILPSEFLARAHEEVKRFGVSIRHTTIINGRKNKDGSFTVIDTKNREYIARKLLLAPGLMDIIPTLKGIDDLYGKSVFHCPYCDAWEVRDKKIAVYARTKNGFDLALALTRWTNSVMYFTDGRLRLEAGQLNKLNSLKIPVITDRIIELKGENGQLKEVVCDRKSFAADALFFVNGYYQQSSLVEKLGCRISSKRSVITNKNQQTNIAGLYVAGDAARDMHFVVVAAAEGAKAAVTINKELLAEEH